MDLSAEKSLLISIATIGSHYPLISPPGAGGAFRAASVGFSLLLNKSPSSAATPPARAARSTSSEAKRLWRRAHRLKKMMDFRPRKHHKQLKKFREELVTVADAKDFTAPSTTSRPGFWRRRHKADYSIRLPLLRSILRTEKLRWGHAGKAPGTANKLMQKPTHESDKA